MQFPLRSLRAVVCSLGLLTIFPAEVLAQKVLLLAAEPMGAEQVRVKLEGTLRFTQVDLLRVDEPNSTPTLTTLLEYDAVLTWTDAPYDAPDALGDVLADYVDAGHGVVQAAFANFNSPGNSLGGRWGEQSYDAFTPGGMSDVSGLTLVPVQPGHPILDRVLAFNGETGSAQMGLTVVNGTIVANWSNGEPLVSERSGPLGGRIVGLNVWPALRTDDIGTDLIANALLFATTPNAVTNQPPTANAGLDQTHEAAGPAGAAFTVTGAGSDPDGNTLTYAWSGPATGTGESWTVSLTLPAGSRSATYGVLLTVSDGKGGEATDVVNLTVRDTTGPVLANVPAPLVTAVATSASGADVSYGSITAMDAVDGDTPVSCSKSGAFPIGDTPVTCSATDTRGNSTTASFTVRVANVATSGVMWGEGTIRVGTLRHEIEFAVGEQRSFQGALLQVRVKDERFPRKSGHRFSARSTTFVAFSDDPAVRPGAARVDSVVFSGTGDWNGHAGHQYQMSVVDKGESGHRRMGVRLTVTGPNGAVVARVDGTLGGGGSSGSSALRRR